ncbi:glyoxalase [Deinococcus ruber]|uniref:Glyoxalase n=1 Tax=Deinococcus ruber TaxID=1848197 RepID=A0A918BYR5_9DEIO|nr:glyoxalase [Deinococcus ruber]GGQ98724.1 glyoxalase [Deinococcus ruber]
MLISGLDHVQIEAPAGHEEQARRYYTGFLELPELHKPEALQKNGGVWFALPDGRQLHTGVVAAFVPRTKGHPCLRCTDLDALLRRAAEFQVPAEEDFQLVPLRRAYLSDPFGNRLEVVQGQHESVVFSI